MFEKGNLFRAFDAMKFPKDFDGYAIAYFSFDTPASHMRDFFNGVGRPIKDYVTLSGTSVYPSVDYFILPQDHAGFLAVAQASSYVMGLTTVARGNENTVRILHQKEGFRHEALNNPAGARVALGSAKP